MLIYLGLGSNLGDRKAALLAARDAIAALPEVDEPRLSPLYETPPMGPQDQGPYINAVLEIDTTPTILAPEELLNHLQSIEKSLGRPPRENRTYWGPRVIDLDILIAGNITCDRPGLTIPHPRMADRWFVLKPLADLAPELVHPVTGKTIAAMLTDLESLDPDARGTKIT